MRRIFGIAGLALALGGCASARLPVAARPPALPATEAVLYLIGDAGDATRDLPVLRQLHDDLLALADGTPATVAFLGDNIYGYGLRDPTNRYFAADSARLEAQVDVLRGTPARGIFLPGNHDWADGGPDGLRRIGNQTAFIERRAQAGIDVAMLPASGCPGPVTRDLGDAAALVFLDTHWWLHSEDGRRSPACPRQTEIAVVDELERILEDAVARGRPTVVLGHHPLESYGPHGGYFTLRQVLFPLTDPVPWLYLPLPLVYPIARNAGITSQDLSSPKNRRMREALTAVFRRVGGGPLAYAAGHEHSLQIMDGTPHGVRLHIVSGAGSKLTNVSASPRTDFVAGRQHGELGYAKLEFLSDGSVLLSVLTDGTQGCEREAGDPPCPPGPRLRFTVIVG